MPFNPSDFRAQLQGDGARPNLFEVQMPFPAVISPGNASQKITFMARASHLPGQTLGITPVYYQGREIKLAGNRTVADWSFTVINDTDFVIRNAFERWMSGINSLTGNSRNVNLANLAAYSVNPSVKQFNALKQTIKSYTMIGCWPNDISPIDLDWSANDSLEEFTVSLVVQEFEDPDNGVV